MIMERYIDLAEFSLETGSPATQAALKLLV